MWKSASVVSRIIDVILYYGVSDQLHAATALVSGKELGTHWKESCLVLRPAVNIPSMNRLSVAE
jgi:hypothetical protein